MPVKIVQAVLIFFYLLKVVISKKFRKFDFILEDVNHTDLFISLLRSFSISRTIKITEILYAKNIFNCLTCSIFLRKFLPSAHVKLFIGIRNDDDDAFKSHSWIRYNKNYILGSNNINKQYKIIIEK